LFPKIKDPLTWIVTETLMTESYCSNHIDVAEGGNVVQWYSRNQVARFNIFRYVATHPDVMISTDHQRQAPMTNKYSLTRTSQLKTYL
jgi:hypothetical protein